MVETAAPRQPELIQVLVPMALPSPASPPSLLSGSGSPPTPCQAISALLTGNKTNLTIKSESFFFLGYVLKRLSGGRTERHGWQEGEGRSTQLEVGQRQLRPRAPLELRPRAGALGGEALLEGAGKGSLLQQP